VQRKNQAVGRAPGKRPAVPFDIDSMRIFYSDISLTYERCCDSWDIEDPAVYNFGYIGFAAPILVHAI
jgi:hypothetical protein